MRKYFGSNSYQNNDFNSFNKSSKNINNIINKYNYKNKNLSSYYSSYNNKNYSLNRTLANKTILPTTIHTNFNYINQKSNKSLTNKSGQYTYRNNTNNTSNTSKSSLYEKNNDKNSHTLNNRQNHSYFERKATNPKFLRNKMKSISYNQLPGNLSNYNNENNNIKNVKQTKISSINNRYFQDIKFATIDLNKGRNENTYLIPKENNRYNLNNNHKHYSYRKEDSNFVRTEIEQSGHRKNIINNNKSVFQSKALNDGINLNNSRNNKKYSKSMYNSPINASKNIKKEENLFGVVNKEIGIKNLGNTCFIN